MKITEVLNLDNQIYHNSEKYSEYWSSSNIKNYMKTPREAIYCKTKAEHIVGQLEGLRKVDADQTNKRSAITDLK